MPGAHSSCVLDRSLEARLQYTLCILYLNQMTPMPYCSLTPLMHSTRVTEQLHCTTSGFCMCPIIAFYAINTYRQPARLFVIGGKDIVSAEGTTQGDPLAMGLYALSIQPLITSLQAASSVKKCWFADDASGAGSIMETRTCWDAFSTLGPDFGYFPNDGKCWIIAKPAKEESVREAFKDTSINVTVQGQK